MKATTTAKITDCLEEIFSRRGLPRTYKSNIGLQFASGDFGEFCCKNGI